jgi:septum formation protein
LEKIVLASASPRRRELLAQIGIENFEILPAASEPHLPGGVHPADAVKLISAAKAAEVAVHRPDALIIAADTVVAVDNMILGKPSDRNEAFAHLRELAGRAHAVYTGVTVRRGERVLTECEKSDVFFLPLTDGQICRYIDAGESADKAGSYAVQGLGSLFVRRIEGDYFNVMGLPLCLLGRMLEKFGVGLL